MKQFCTKIDIISLGRENVLFLPSNMAAMTSHENALYCTYIIYAYNLTGLKTPAKLFMHPKLCEGGSVYYSDTELCF